LTLREKQLKLSNKDGTMTALKNYIQICIKRKDQNEGQDQGIKEDIVVKEKNEMIHHHHHHPLLLALVQIVNRDQKVHVVLEVLSQIVHHHQVLRRILLPHLRLIRQEIKENANQQKNIAKKAKKDTKSHHQRKRSRKFFILD